ncbi:MAG: hypothetical protein Q8R91_04770 [Candidatus Omnitrophota bacterium]|nr:hypothetical protein [Candidatus Omnitrophota bacterium]
MIRLFSLVGVLMFAIIQPLFAESEDSPPTWTDGQILTHKVLSSAADVTTGIVVRYETQLRELKTKLAQNSLSTEQATQRVADLESQLATLKNGLALTQREAELASKEAQLAQHAASVNNWIIGFLGVIVGWFFCPLFERWRASLGPQEHKRSPTPPPLDQATPVSTPQSTQPSSVK